MLTKKIKTILVHCALICIICVTLFPFVWMIISTTNTSMDIISGKMTFGSNLQENIANLTAMYDVGRIMLNTLVIAGSIMVLSVFVGAASAYGFEMFPSKNREKIFKLLLLTMMIPFTACMIPLFKLISTIGIYDTLLAVIVPGIASVFTIFLIRSNLKTFPKEIIQAARIDGANEWEIFYKIVLPSIKATLATAAIMSFLAAFNSYLWPLIVLQSPDMITLPLMISQLGSSYNPDKGVIMVALFISTIPPLIVFFGLQKYFVAGLEGSIK